MNRKRAPVVVGWTCPLIEMNSRRSIRKKIYDDSAAGDCFAALCTRNREPLLGGIIEDRIFASAFGVIATLVGAPLAGARPVVRPNRVVFLDLHTTRLGIPSVRAGATTFPANRRRKSQQD